MFIWQNLDLELLAGLFRRPAPRKPASETSKVTRPEGSETSANDARPTASQ